MRKHWTTFLVSFLSFVAFACIPAQAQTLCGVAKVNRTGDQVKIKFEGKKDFDGVVIEGAKRSPIKLKSGQLSRSDNKADDLEAGLGNLIYFSEGFDRSCVLAIEQRNGKTGVYLEQQDHVQGQSPKLFTEFIEVL
jgi:hypothetical protein